MARLLSMGHERKLGISLADPAEMIQNHQGNFRTIKRYYFGPYGGWLRNPAPPKGWLKAQRNHG